MAFGQHGFKLGCPVQVSNKFAHGFIALALHEMLVGVLFREVVPACFLGILHVKEDFGNLGAYHAWQHVEGGHGKGCAHHDQQVDLSRHLLGCDHEFLW